VLAEIGFVVPGDPVPACVDLHGLEERLVLQQAETIESEERRTVMDLLDAVDKGHPQAPVRQRLNRFDSWRIHAPTPIQAAG